MKPILKKILKIAVGIILFIALLILASYVGNQIFKARYFKTLDDFDFVAAEAKETTGCILHDRIPANPPLVVNINKGSAADIRLYDTDRQYQLQISDKTDYGVMWMVGGVGWSGAAFPDNNYAHFSFQRKEMFNYSPEAAEHFFCEDCLSKIEELEPVSNFVIVDAYELDNLKFYDIEDMKDLKIRHYSFTILDKTADLLSCEMHSSYFDGGKELDFLNKE